MSLAVQLRRGKGPFWSRAKRLIRAALSVHLPVVGVTKLMFGWLYRLHVALRESLICARRFFWCEPLFRSQCERVGQRFQMEQLPYIVGHGAIVLGDNVRLSGKPSICFLNRWSAPRLAIGDDTFIGHGCSFNVGSAITIGNHCYLAAGVSISTHDGHPLDAARRRAGEPPSRESIQAVTIGNDVWIGAGAVILKGASIGDRSVVGARAVVTRPVPPDVVVAGNPARIVKYSNRADGVDDVPPHHTAVSQ